MSQKIRIKLKSYDHNLVDKSAEKIVKTVKRNRRSGQRTNSIANSQENIHCQPLDFRKQEIARAIPTLIVQTLDRHLQLDS